MWKTYSGNWSTFVLVCTMSLSWITQLYVFQLSPDQSVHDMTLPRLLTSFFLSASFWTWTPKSWHTSNPVWNPQTQTKSLQLQHCRESFIDFWRLFYWLCCSGDNLWLFPRWIIVDLIQLTATGPIGRCHPSTSISHYGHYEQGEAREKYRFASKTLLVPLPAAQTQLSLGIRDASARVGLVSFWAPILDYIWNNSPEPWALIQDATRQLWECEERAKSRTLTIEGARQGGV